ncbi:MAG: hypothetical protein WD875_07670 [Pirellulales bacterium]
MELKECTTRRAQAAAEIVDREKLKGGDRVTHSLSDGLTTLRNALYKRLHDDFELIVGTDSMIIVPASSRRTENLAKVEIEIYQIAVGTGHAVEFGYVSDVDWCNDWLTYLRLGDGVSQEHARRRLGEYLEITPADRRLHFTNVLTRALREASQAPLVLFRLFPLSVRIATSIAFADHVTAADLRNQQLNILPAIADCHHCHGRLLDNEETCDFCGNPVWTHKWLTAVD